MVQPWGTSSWSSVHSPAHGLVGRRRRVGGTRRGWVEPKGTAEQNCQGSGGHADVHGPTHGISQQQEKPSHGSLLHEAGRCKPCAWFWKPVGCLAGTQCGFCHSCPEGTIRARRKARAAAMRTRYAGTPDEVNKEVDSWWDLEASVAQETWCELHPNIQEQPQEQEVYPESLTESSRSCTREAHSESPTEAARQRLSLSSLLFSPGVPNSPPPLHKPALPFSMCGQDSMEIDETVPPPPLTVAAAAQVAPEVAEPAILAPIQATRAPIGRRALDCELPRSPIGQALGVGTSLLTLPCSPKSAAAQEARILVIVQSGMLDAFEVPPSVAETDLLDGRCSRSASCPPQFHQADEDEAGDLIRGKENAAEQESSQAVTDETKSSGENVQEIVSPRPGRLAPRETLRPKVWRKVEGSKPSPQKADLPMSPCTEAQASARPRGRPSLGRAGPRKAPEECLSSQQLTTRSGVRSRHSYGGGSPYQLGARPLPR